MSITSNRRRNGNGIGALTAVGLGLLLASSARCAEPLRIRIGHFPNITHAQALLARADNRFEESLGLPVEWTVFNAGPSAVEAMFAGAVDATYIGPNPVINGHIKSRGACLRIVAGSASGGAALVVRADSGILDEAGFHGRTVATPQLGNTQDVAARVWFARHGYRTREQGGDLTLMPIANPDQLSLFLKKELDAAWTIEPWVSRLVIEGGGRVFLDEGALWPAGRYVTAQLVVSAAFLERHPDAVRRLLRAHVELTRRLQAKKEAAVAPLLAQIKALTAKDMPAAVTRSALARIEFTWDPLSDSLRRSAQDAVEIGFLKGPISLDGLYCLEPVNEVLAEMNMPPVK